MIFSTDRCPLCNEKLEMDVETESVFNSITFIYSCKTKELRRNDSNTNVVAQTHYESKFYGDDKYSRMIYPEFLVAHFSSINTTRIFTNSTTEPNKFIFQIPLLDVDYSQTHAVCARLKLLVPFS